MASLCLGEMLASNHSCDRCPPLTLSPAYVLGYNNSVSLVDAFPAKGKPPRPVKLGAKELEFKFYLLSNLETHVSGEGKVNVDIYERGGAAGKIQTPGTSRAKHGNTRKEAREAAGLESTEHAGARVGKPGVLTSRNLPSGSKPHPGQDRRGASESRERPRRTLSPTRRTSRRVRGGTKAPPTSGAQRLAQARPHFYWWSCGACVMCGARVRSVSPTVPGRGKRGRAQEFAPGGTRPGIAGAKEAVGSRDSRLRSGMPSLRPPDRWRVHGVQ